MVALDVKVRHRVSPWVGQRLSVCGQRPQRGVALGLGQLGELSHGIIKPGPVAALAFEQGFKRGHQFVVCRLGGKTCVVGLGHPAVVARQLGVGRIAGHGRQPLRAKLVIAGPKTLHCF